jgi:hypothetical protein
MLISDIHAAALQLLNSDNSDYDAPKLMGYTNDGILYVQNIRIQSNDPEAITQATTTFLAPIAKPVDFFAFVPPKSSYPVNFIGGQIVPINSSFQSVTFKYSRKANRVVSITDTFPLPDEFSGFVAQYISCRLQSDNSMNVTQDLNILQNDISAFLKAKGG